MLNKLVELTNELSIVNIETTESKELEAGSNPSNIKISLKTLVKKNSWYFCDNCDYKTKHRKGLIIRISKMHEQLEKKHTTDNTESFFKCNICENKEQTLEAMIEHMHNFENPVKCLNCSFKNEGCAIIHAHIKFHHDPNLKCYSRVLILRCCFE